MQALMPLVEQVIIDRLLSQRAPLMRKNKIGIGLMVLAGVMLLLGLVFAALAGYGWLLMHYPQPTAALITAGFILGLSILSSLIGVALLQRRAPPPRRQNEEEIMEAVSEIMTIVSEELAEPIKENPKTAVILSGVAGFAAGERMYG